MFIASYNFPVDEDSPEPSAKECKTRREALIFLRDAYRTNGMNRFYNPQIFDEDKQRIVTITKNKARFIYE